MVVKAWAPDRLLDFGRWTDAWSAGHEAAPSSTVGLRARMVPRGLDAVGISAAPGDYGDVIQGHPDTVTLEVARMEATARAAEGITWIP
jgi:hypothetical protein